MDAAKLIKMANSIADFFDGEPDRAIAIEGVAGHLRRFWDPRMRRALLAHVEAHGGAGLKPTVLEAITTHRATLAPPA